MKIEWDNRNLNAHNRGTDGHGLVAWYDTLGKAGEIVHLGFHFYTDRLSEDEIDGLQLAELSQKIGDLIHEHLGR